MKLLLDENLPKRLKGDFPAHDLHTVRDMGWEGKTNGELLAQMMQYDFDVLLTFDRNLQYQQNFKKYTLPVLVQNCKDNTYSTLRMFVPNINEMLASKLRQGPNFLL